MSPKDLTPLVGSRICHDLISPIGAVGNGIELLAMSGVGHSPEMQLIAESIEAANARIRFFRVAYGAAGDDQTIRSADVRSILKSLTRASRVTFGWDVAHDTPRNEVKCVFLALQSLESALPSGGEVRITSRDGFWELTATGPVLRAEETLWSGIAGPAASDGITSAQVQFGLLPIALSDLGREARIDVDEGTIRIGF